MQIKQNIENNIAIISLAGQMKVNINLDLIEAAVKTALENGYSKIIIDLNNVREIDYTGLGLILNISQDVKRANAKLRLCGLQQRHKELLQSSKLINGYGVEFFNTVEGAKNNF